MKHFLLAVIAAATALTVSAQTEVTTYQPGVTAEGITYFLPRTGLHVTLVATRTIHTPGEYAAYAERYLRLKDVPQTTYDEWQITGIAVTPFGTADKSKAYSVKLKSKTSAPLVSLAADGRLLAINVKDAPAEQQLSTPSVVKNDAKHLNPADYKTEEILSAGSVTKMAELTADEIYDIRENRTLLTKGQADFMPKDGEQLRLMLASLDTQEEALLQLFKGTTDTETHTFTLDYVPDSIVDKAVLFRFSKHLGMVDADDLAGEPYYISVSDLKTLPAETATADGKPKKEVEGVRYIVPSKAAVKVFDAKREIYSNTFPMAQLGRVECLGGDLFNKKFGTHVYFSPETGAIAKIEAEGM